ncbi:DUF3619 family protein [Lacisediminimonas sp.]|uniref:DUF3619 family protein n=1 Tax=Lacisediminimonas sp. TaxID=3060582 RepID=UPI00271B7B8C|nr:DUF3619 family protein [Lacisediminimonas sp.]MDO8300211.1 DUF3619 family protein [Lacisediminimonas sp.]MDO9217783.1 DUF3619 family protein [Lacisediminimonas sp.]
MNVRQINFAYRVRHALNEHLESMPAQTADRLAAARAVALQRKKPDAPQRQLVTNQTFAGRAGGVFGDRLSWLARMGAVLPMIVVAAGIFALYHSEYQQRISDVAEMDAMVLSDELPLKAYLDNGFNAYLAKRTD